MLQWWTFLKQNTISSYGTVVGFKVVCLRWCLYGSWMMFCCNFVVWSSDMMLGISVQYGLSKKALNGFCLQFFLSHTTVLHLSVLKSAHLIFLVLHHENKSFNAQELKFEDKWFMDKIICCLIKRKLVTIEKILLQWKVGSGRIKIRLFQCQCQQDFSCLHWNDAGHCLSFLRESPKMAKIYAEEKFQQNQIWSCM